MIPSVLAQYLKLGVEDFLRTTFPVSTPFFNGIIERLLSEDGGIFKGPYLSVQLPFRQGEEGQDYFPDIPLNFQPYFHQEKAFQRLSGTKPHSTIVATGTGSGKTECFVYPILDYCYQHRGEPGIKAILIYPMNALATDQAGRLARIIWDNTKLRGHVTAGLFVGQSEHNPRMVMGPDGIITNKETQRLNPPDILLTNYKMLDYLLIRPKDFRLWQHNGTDTLRFLVVDELHTFDGAQGTDLSCLLRRLKARLGTRRDFLCCIGTSATLGSDKEKKRLIQYVEEVFGEPFDENAIISESQLNSGEFLAGVPISYAEIVPPQKAPVLDPGQYEGYRDYILSQYELWFGEHIDKDAFDQDEWRIDLGEGLKGHIFFQNLLKSLQGKILSYDQILSNLEELNEDIKDSDPVYLKNLLTSMMALVSEARVWKPEDKENKEQNGKEEIERQQIAPFLQIRIHLWLRELRRMVGEISRQPCIRFADDLNDEQLRIHLPVVHCRECGSMGWAGIKRKYDNALISDLQTFYVGFFNYDSKVVFLFPDDTSEQEQIQDGAFFGLCPSCLHLTDLSGSTHCSSCDNKELIRTFLPNTRVQRNNRMISIHDCPYCNATDSLTLLGSRAASLTSVLISQLYSSGFNNDKKLLTFSDSVQDAAHRAGFFAGRTFRFNFRIALQKFMLDSGNGLALADLPKAFIDYWTKGVDEKTYIATFLAPNMAWLRDYDYLRKHDRLPKGSRLIQYINLRIGWEIQSEYGFSARIGRTLEKTSSSVAHLDQEKLEGLIDRLLEQVRNEVGELRDIDRISLNRFLAGIIVQLKNKGAVFHPILKSYIEDWGKTYLISRILWMPNFGPRTRAPVFLTTYSGTRFDQVLSQSPKYRTWYEDWAARCFMNLPPLDKRSMDCLYGLVLKAFVEEGVFEERAIKGHRVWGIRPDALRVSTRVLQFYCTRCGHNVSVESSEKIYWEGSPCLRFQCKGYYQEGVIRLDYYGKLYAKGEVNRIFAAEHTGLLTREERERLEQEFRADEKSCRPWYPNLLSCTPTLEMGIDIGDLSTVILCSVPPAQANYLQRIGRAGRRDGNALNLTVANGRPHDLYFFAEPEQMIAGQVDPPGIFLNASAVLERQFTAFCLDRWVESDVPVSIFPINLGQILDNLEPAVISSFPHNFLSFIETHQTVLLDDFLALFYENLTEDSIQHIQNFVESEGGLRYRIMEGLHNSKKERDTLRKKIKALRTIITKKEKDPAKDKNHKSEIDELKREKGALQAIVRQINRCATFNFFTDEGLIPNYTFPEAGIILRSVIFRKRDKTLEGEDLYENWVYEYERAAVSAINELAPENHFYAGGRRVKVDQVDMEMSEVETWRFCNLCSHMELIGMSEEKSECPRCGSTMWSDQGQKRRMLRMRRVFASTPDSRSRIADDSDDRDPKFYNKQMLVDFDETHITDAYRVDNDDLPFGFEFLAKATFREVNFGEKGEFGENVVIAGLEFPRKGFSLCRYCGKIQDHRGEIQHVRTCKARNLESDRSLVDCIYLYREFTSEAIRILLPVTTFTPSDRKLISFIAAIQLGLKLKFRGKIDHLQVTIYDEPVPQSEYRKRYIILYDTIPGGTGYLKQLMRSGEPLLEVFDLAFNALRSCTCNQNPNKDGCYSCLYAYRNSYNMQETSREAAMEMLSEILRHRDRLTKTDTLKKVPVIGLIDSELEALFIEALRQVRRYDKPVSMSKGLYKNKPGYFFKIGDRAYYIVPQVSLGSKEGISISSCADFVFYPARTQEDIKPIAVFTDGYLYHRDRIGYDMAQRMAIAQSEGFDVWSFTWRDVKNRFMTQGDFFRNYLNPGTKPNGEKYTELLEGYGLEEEFRKLHLMDSFELFVQFLMNPNERLWRMYAFVNGLINIDIHRFESKEASDEWGKILSENVTEDILEVIDDLNGPCLYGLFEAQDHWTDRSLRLFVRAEKDAVSRSDVEGMRLACWLNDGPENRENDKFEPVWNGYLRLFNIFQFLPHSFFVTEDGLAKNAYEGLKLRKVVTLAVPYAKAEKEEWAEIIDLTSPDNHDLLIKLSESGWPVPEIGYELIDTQGEIIATAEMAWEEKRLAFLREDEFEFAKAFEKAGWRITLLSDVLANPEDYISLNKT